MCGFRTWGFAYQTMHSRKAFEFIQILSDSCKTIMIIAKSFLYLVIIWSFTDYYSLPAYNHV